MTHFIKTQTGIKKKNTQNLKKKKIINPCFRLALLFGLQFFFVIFKIPFNSN